MPGAVNQNSMKAVMAAERMRLLLEDFDRLANSIELNSAEVCIVINRAPSTLKAWEKIPDHPIKWKRRGKQKSCTVGDLRRYLRSEQPRKRPAKNSPAAAANVT